MDDASSRTVLSEGFKGMDENSCSFLQQCDGKMGREERREGGGRKRKKPPVNFYHISESFVGLASA